MFIPRLRTPLCGLLLGCVWLSGLARPAAAQEDASQLVVRDVNVMVMSAYGSHANARDLFRSTLPGFMLPKRATADRRQLNLPSPCGLMTFSGRAESDLDVLLEFDAGRFLACWPPANQRSKRLLWAHLKLSEAPTADPTPLPEGHWLAPLRSADRLAASSEHRTEKFLLYDAELPQAPPIKVTSAEGGYGLQNTQRFPLFDVQVLRPQDGGWVLAEAGQVDPAPGAAVPAPESAPASPMPPAASPEAVFSDGLAPAATAAAPAATATAAPEVVPAAPLDAAPTATPAVSQDAAAPAANAAPEAPIVTVAAAASPATREALRDKWRARLQELGLGPEEAAHAAAILQQHALRSDTATVIARLGEEQTDVMLPLEVTPLPDRQVRITLLVLLDADPDLHQRVEALVGQLGASSYAEREAAQKRLIELGPAARPKVQDAVNNSDPEIAHRAEMILEALTNPAGAPPGAGGDVFTGL